MRIRSEFAASEGRPCAASSRRPLARNCSRRGRAFHTRRGPDCRVCGILVDANHWRERLLIAHELVHVMQYERLGGVRPFLREYIADCLRCGYSGAGLELEAAEVAGRVVTGE